jgi:hypothetical protein
MKAILRGIIVMIVAATIAWCAQLAIDNGKLGDLHFAEGRGSGFRVGGNDDGGEGRRRGQGSAGELIGTLLEMTAIGSVVVIGGRIRQARRRRRTVIQS